MYKPQLLPISSKINWIDPLTEEAIIKLGWLLWDYDFDNGNWK